MRVIWAFVVGLAIMPVAVGLDVLVLQGPCQDLCDLSAAMTLAFAIPAAVMVAGGLVAAFATGREDTWMGWLAMLLGLVAATTVALSWPGTDYDLTDPGDWVFLALAAVPASAGYLVGWAVGALRSQAAGAGE